jgi:hypothetical protein
VTCHTLLDFGPFDRIGESGLSQNISGGVFRHADLSPWRANFF